MMPVSEHHDHLAFVLALFVAALGAVYDIRTGAIPNWVTYPAFAVGPLAHGARALVRAKGLSDDALHEAGYSLAGIVVCALVPLVMYRRGGMGAADVKLFAAIGACLQVTWGFEAQLYAFVAAALFAPAKLLFEGKLWRTLKNAFALGANAFLPKDKQNAVDESLLSWIRMGPAALFGVALTAVQHW
jgi:prepilin peptidase CpaA